MYLANKDLDDEAFKDLERLQHAKKSLEFKRHPADVQTEYQIYSKAISDLQKQYAALHQEFKELNASYSIVCEHSVKLETALNKAKRTIEQAEKSWLTALLIRLGLKK